MPYAKEHYPFENQEKNEKNPADFVVEYKAQTRGWFYTLMVLSAALFDKPPFLKCICHGIVLDEKGQTLSKRYNNFANPKDVLEIYGAEALRFMMLSSSVVSRGDLLLNKDAKNIKDYLTQTIYRFFNQK